MDEIVLSLLLTIASINSFYTELVQHTVHGQFNVYGWPGGVRGQGIYQHRIILVYMKETILSLTYITIYAIFIVSASFGK